MQLCGRSRAWQKYHNPSALAGAGMVANVAGSGSSRTSQSTSPTVMVPSAAIGETSSSTPMVRA